MKLRKILSICGVTLMIGSVMPALNLVQHTSNIVKVNASTNKNYQNGYRNGKKIFKNLFAGSADKVTYDMISHDRQFHNSSYRRGFNKAYYVYHRNHKGEDYVEPKDIKTIDQAFNTYNRLSSTGKKGFINSIKYDGINKYYNHNVSYAKGYIIGDSFNRAIFNHDKYNLDLNNKISSWDSYLDMHGELSFRKISTYHQAKIYYTMLHADEYINYYAMSPKAGKAYLNKVIKNNHMSSYDKTIANNIQSCDLVKSKFAAGLVRKTAIHRNIYFQTDTGVGGSLYGVITANNRKPRTLKAIRDYQKYTRNIYNHNKKLINRKFHKEYNDKLIDGNKVKWDTGYATTYQITNRTHPSTKITFHMPFGYEGFVPKS